MSNIIERINVVSDIAADILELAAKGDIGAFEQVYKATGGFVYNVAWRVTRNSQDAQEVTQDVFMKIYRNLKSFRFRSSFRTWVYRITVNTAINRYRLTLRENKGRTDYDKAEHNIYSAPDEPLHMQQADNKAALDNLLQQLNPDQKTCIILREIEGLSYQDIAAALKIPVNTVRSRLKRGRETLLQYARGRQNTP